ncbi:MAG: hypothetical protein ABR564_06325 [Candidatus Dormibacteria bacterium]
MPCSLPYAGIPATSVSTGYAVGGNCTLTAAERQGKANQGSPYRPPELEGSRDAKATVGPSVAIEDGHPEAVEGEGGDGVHGLDLLGLGDGGEHQQGQWQQETQARSAKVGGKPGGAVPGRRGDEDHQETPLG